MRPRRSSIQSLMHQTLQREGRCAQPTAQSNLLSSIAVQQQAVSATASRGAYKQPIDGNKDMQTTVLERSYRLVGSMWLSCMCEAATRAWRVCPVLGAFIWTDGPLTLNRPRLTYCFLFEG